MIELVQFAGGVKRKREKGTLSAAVILSCGVQGFNSYL